MNRLPTTLLSRIFSSDKFSELERMDLFEYQEEIKQVLWSHDNLRRSVRATDTNNFSLYSELAHFLPPPLAIKLTDRMTIKLTDRNTGTARSRRQPKTPIDGKLTLTSKEFVYLFEKNQLDNEIHYHVTGSVYLCDDHNKHKDPSLPKKLTIDDNLSILLFKNLKKPPDHLIVKRTCEFINVGFTKLPDTFNADCRLLITDCDSFTELSKELKVRYCLEISNCHLFSTLASGVVTPNITIKNCPNFSTIEDGFTLLKSLTIDNCPKLDRLTELTVGHHLSVHNCPALTAISAKVSVGAGLSLQGCTALESLAENMHVPWGLNLKNCRSYRALPQKIFLGGTLTLTGCCSITSLPDWVTRLGVDKDGRTRDIHLEGTGLSKAFIADLLAIKAPGIQLHLPNIKKDYKKYYFDLLAEEDNRNRKIHSDDNESSLPNRLMRQLIDLGKTSESAEKTGRHIIFYKRHIVEMKNNNGYEFLMFRSTGKACLGTEGCWVPFPGILNSENHKDWLIKGWNEGSYQYSYEDIKHHQYHIPFFQNVAIQLSEEEHRIFPELPDRSTRKDKHKHNQPFTTVDAKSLDGQVFTAELLNTLPGQVLSQMDYDPTWINQLPEREKKTPLSANAVKSLTKASKRCKFTDDPTTKASKRCKFTDDPTTKAKYIGESMSPVKFARLCLPGSDVPVICAAKKIHKPFLQTNRLINEEACRHNSSGYAPKVYGVAKTVTKDGKAQRILFMDIAKGINGDQFIRSNKNTLPESKKIELAQNFATTVQSMHKNDVFHGDLKPDNSFIDPKTLNIQLIDFGQASGPTRTASRNSFNISTSPELSLPCNLWTNETTIDMEKVDVFSLGYILTTLFGSKTFAADGKKAASFWNPDANITELENIIHNELSSITFSNPAIKAFVTQMMGANPANRPTMEVVVNTIHSWSAQTAKEQDRTGQDMPDLFIR